MPAAGEADGYGRRARRSARSGLPSRGGDGKQGMVSAGDKGAPAGRGETPCGQRPIGQRGTFSSGLRYARASREADTRARTRREQRTPSPTTRGQRQGAGRGRLSGGGAVRVAATEPGPATGGHVRSQGRLQHRRVQPLGRGHVVAGTAHFNYWTLTENSLKRRQETQEEGAGRSPPVSGRGEESRAQAGPPRRSEQTRAPLRSDAARPRVPTRQDAPRRRRLSAGEARATRSGCFTGSGGFAF